MCFKGQSLIIDTYVTQEILRIIFHEILRLFSMKEWQRPDESLIIQQRKMGRFSKIHRKDSIREKAGSLMALCSLFLDVRYTQGQKLI